MKTTRRSFLMGCSAAVAAYSGSHFNTLAFGAPGDPGDILVSVFLRGGMDGLNLVLPISGADRGYYENARPNLAVPLAGSRRALGLDSRFGFHPSTNAFPTGQVPPATLFELFQANKLSLVVAAGMHEENRSHFDSMAFMELGTPGQIDTATGWLSRHLQSQPGGGGGQIPSLAVGSANPQSLQGALGSVNMSSPDAFSLEVGPWQWRDAWRVGLRNLYNGPADSWMHRTGTEALDTIDLLELSAAGSYTPSNGAIYPNGSFGDHLRTIARMIKLDLGLRVATIDFGGWDTHNGQGDDGGGYFASHVEELARGLAAFYTDLDGAGAQNYTDRLNVVTLSEFGRRLRQNADRGCDHGHGNMMMVLSGNATGGIHGAWPGLANAQLFDGADLEVTTDYRRVLSEILIRRMGNPNLGEVFPGFNGYEPLGVVQGEDTAPVYGPEIFLDGFEGGDTSRWSSTRG